MTEVTFRARGLLRRRRTVVVVLSLLGAFLVAQFATYWSLAEAAMPVAAIRRLADYDHLCEARCRWQFAYVKKESWGALTEAQRKALDAELNGLVPTVYYSYADVPEAMIATQPLTDEHRKSFEERLERGDSRPEHREALKRQLATGRMYVGLKDGFGVNWDLRSSGLFWMRCGSGFYVSPTGAEGMDAIYVWVLGFWVRVYTVSHWMA